MSVNCLKITILVFVMRNQNACLEILTARPFLFLILTIPMLTLTIHIVPYILKYKLKYIYFSSLAKSCILSYDCLALLNI